MQYVMKCNYAVEGLSLEALSERLYEDMGRLLVPEALDLQEGRRGSEY